MAPKSPKVPTATTAEDNDYNPQQSSYDPCYSGDLDEFDKEFEQRDAKVDATRAEFGRPKPSKGVDD